MMCAAHIPDLLAIRSCGLRTGFIYRPNEYGGDPVGVPDKAKPSDSDVVSISTVDLAQQMALNRGPRDAAAGLIPSRPRGLLRQTNYGPRCQKCTAVTDSLLFPAF
jgi:hypothetical protein